MLVGKVLEVSGVSAPPVEELKAGRPSRPDANGHF